MGTAGPWATIRASSPCRCGESAQCDDGASVAEMEYPTCQSTIEYLANVSTLTHDPIDRATSLFRSQSAKRGSLPTVIYTDLS